MQSGARKGDVTWAIGQSGFGWSRLEAQSGFAGRLGLDKAATFGKMLRTLKRIIRAGSILCVLLTCQSLALISGNDGAAAEIADLFPEAGIVVLGEVHDNPAHHATQAAIVELLQPDALVFEMIEPTRALSVNPDNRGNAVELQRVLGWRAGGWPDFAMYHPIFTAAPDAAVFGAAVAEADVRKAVRQGAAAVFGDAAVLFGLDRPLDQDQLETRLELQREAHCYKLPDDLLPSMVEAQRLRDAALAEAAVAAFEHAKATDELPLVVIITGNGHAREDWGVPEMLATYYGDDPEIEIRTLAQFEIEPPEDPPYSNWLTTEPAEREDPCEAFRE